jgi:hypothetical protein
MFDQVYDGIYVGELEAVDNQAAVRAEGITAVVRLDEHDRSTGQWNDAFALLDMPIPDGEYLDSDTIDTITEFINQQIEAGGKVLIHCQMGISFAGNFFGFGVLILGAQDGREGRRAQGQQQNHHTHTQEQACFRSHRCTSPFMDVTDSGTAARTSAAHC